jgi:hypothetical protein
MRRRRHQRRRRPLATRTWWLDGLMGAKGASRMSGLGESSASRPLTPCSKYFVVNMCLIYGG